MREKVVSLKMAFEHYNEILNSDAEIFALIFCRAAQNIFPEARIMLMNQENMESIFVLRNLGFFSHQKSCS